MSNSVDTPYLSDEKEENISEISEEAIGPPLDQNQQILQQVNQIKLSLVSRPVYCKYGSRVPVANGLCLLNNTCLITTVVSPNLYFINPLNMNLVLSTKTQKNIVVTLKLSNNKFLASGFADLNPKGALTFYHHSKQRGDDIKVVSNIENDTLDTFALLQQNNQIVSGGSDKNLKVWDIQKIVLLKNLCAENQYEWTNDLITIDQNCFASSGKDTVIRVWDSRIDLCIKTSKLNGMIRCLSYSQQDQKIMFGGEENYFGVWDWINTNDSNTISTSNKVYGMDRIGSNYFFGGAQLKYLNVFEYKSGSQYQTYAQDCGMSVKSVLCFQDRFVIAGTQDRYVFKYKIQD